MENIYGIPTLYTLHCGSCNTDIGYDGVECKEFIYKNRSNMLCSECNSSIKKIVKKFVMITEDGTKVIRREDVQNISRNYSKMKRGLNYDTLYVGDWGQHGKLSLKENIA
jgi:hypothetical protein